MGAPVAGLGQAVDKFMTKWKRSISFKTILSNAVVMVSTSDDMRAVTGRQCAKQVLKVKDGFTLV